MTEKAVNNTDKARRRLIVRSVEDEEFRRRLLAGPKATVEEELGTKLPDWLDVMVVEETAETIYLVLPSAGSPEAVGGELSDRELETVSGGWGDDPSGGYTEERSYECYQKQ